MASEREVKLETSRACAARLADRPWLRRLATAPLSKKRLVSVYYDTEDQDLRDADIALRLRTQDGKTVQTVKRGSAAPARQEWECKVEGHTPDLDRAGDTALNQFNAKKLRRLLPLFETNVTRAVLPVRYQSSQVEIAFDRGEIKTGRKRAPINEIELELKSGDMASLARLAARIASETHARYGVKPKAMRGYDLREDESEDPVRAKPAHAGPAMDAGECFQAIALSSLHHFAANENAVAAGEPEGMHQMRIGLRRLRTAISLFRIFLRGAETEKIKKQLKWLTEELGPARDMDVLAKGRLKDLEEGAPASVTALKQEIASRRAQGFARAKKAMADPRYHRLVLATALWILGGAWLRDKDRLISARSRRGARAFAAAEMSRRLGKILKQQKKLAKLSPKKRHKLRIKVKKLRYAVNFFAGLFQDNKARAKFARALKRLQSSLGKLNDIRVHGKLAADFAHPHGGTKEPQKAFAMGLLSGREDAATKRLVKKSVKRGKRLAALDPFWC